MTATKYRRAFTLLKLRVAFIIMAFPAGIFIPSLLGIVTSASATAATTSLADVAGSSLDIDQADAIKIPTASEITSVVSGTPGYTSQESSLSSPAPSSGYDDISYDSSDSAIAVGFAMRSISGGCGK